MKKLLLCAVALTFSATTLFAQKQGDSYFGGMIGVATNTDSSKTLTTFSLTPEVGHFIEKNVRLGLSLGYGYSSGGERTAHALTIGPTLAYYVRLCDRFYYTPELAFAFAYTSSRGINNYGFAAGLAVGAFEFQPSSRWGISLSLVSLDYSYLTHNGMAGDNLNFQFGINPSVGLKYYF